MKKSRIPKGGKGLFSVKQFQKNDHITLYSGLLVDRQDAKDNPKYNKHILGSVGLVCRGDSVQPGLYANGTHPVSRQPIINARYDMSDIRIVSGSSLKGGIKFTVGMRVEFPIVATRPIDVDEEVIVDYKSDGFWSNNKKWELRNDKSTSSEKQNDSRELRRLARQFYIAPSQHVGYNPETNQFDVQLGQGLFCSHVIQSETDLPDFHGEIINMAEYEKRHKAGRGGYFLGLDDDTVLDCYESRLDGTCKVSCANSAHPEYPIRNILTGELGVKNCKLIKFKGRLRYKTSEQIPPDIEILGNYEPYVPADDVK